MRDTILIAPDKFKGTLTALQATDIITGALEDCGLGKTLRCPMADGGEGTPATLGGDSVILSHDHIGPQCFGNLPVMRRSSHPLGEAVKRMLALGRHFYIGIGGTATVDGGAGLLQALGATFRDADGNEISEHITPAVLPHVCSIELPHTLRTLLAGRATLLYDVEATLHGPGLSSLDFAAQKGATPDDMATIEDGLRNLERLLQPVTATPCDGAGGGTGFALAAVAGAATRQGAEAVLQSYGIDWRRISLVISGEGRIDRQTQGGKVPQLLRSQAERHGIPFLAFGGYVAPEAAEPCYITTITEPSDFAPDRSAERLRAALLANADLIARLTQPTAKGL